MMILYVFRSKDLEMQKTVFKIMYHFPPSIICHLQITHSEGKLIGGFV